MGFDGDDTSGLQKGCFTYLDDGVGGDMGWEKKGAKIASLSIPLRYSVWKILI